MSRVHKSFLTLSAAGLALAAAACSDTTAPTSSLRAGSAAFTLGPTANVGPVQVTFGSGATTQFCSAGTVIHGYTIPASYAPLAGCGTAFDLSANLANSYNPGWSVPLTGSAWIGPNATSNEYRTAPGTYVFQTTFSIPAGVTNPVLNDTLKSDNAVAVFLNGFKVEQQVIADCAAAPCNWDAGGTFIISDANAAHFIIGGTNTITVLLVDTPNGGNAGNSYACIKTPQPNGWRGFVFTAPNAEPTSPNHIVAGWTQTMTATTGCENPTGLDFHGTVSWVVPPPPTTTWCSPGFWKNNGRDLWTQYYTKKYSTLVGAAPLGKKAPAGYDPTLLEVIDNPQIYGGEATNSVADFLSNKAFGTPIGSGVESCPNADDIIVH
jgi:hypothetical protein